MDKYELERLKAELKEEQNLYFTELKTSQKFETLRAIRLKINSLRQQIAAEEQSKGPSGFAGIV